MFKRLTAAVVSVAVIFSFFATPVYAIENADAVQLQITQQDTEENETFAPEISDSEKTVVTEETPDNYAYEAETQEETAETPQQTTENDVQPPAASETEQPVGEEQTFAPEDEQSDETEQSAENNCNVVEQQIAQESVNAVAANSYGTVTYSGNCGADAVWTVYDSDADAVGDTLVISGSGAMDNYTYHYDRPWYSWEDDIKTVVVEDGITTICNYAFYSFDYITKMTIAGTVSHLGDDAFYDCYSLEHIIFNGTWDQWLTAYGNGESYADNRCVIYVNNDFAYKDNGNGTATITGPKGNVGGVVVIPQSINGLTVTAVGEKAFASNTAITGVVFADSVETIGRMAFYETDLKLINFGKGLKTIDDYAFYNSINFFSKGGIDPSDHLTNAINLPEGLEFLGANAFGNLENAHSIKSIYIPSTLKTVEEDGINWSSYISAIVYYNGTPQQWVDLFEDTKTPSMGPMTFAEETIAFEKNDEDSYTIVRWENAAGNIALPTEFRGKPVKHVNSGVFMGNNNITGVVVPEIYSFNDYSNYFNNCKNLVTAEINAKIWSLPSSMFAGCTSLETVKLPYTMGRINENAFKECLSLKDVYYFSSCNWENMTIATGNSLLNDATLHFETDWGYDVYSEYEYTDGVEVRVDAIAITGHSNPPEHMVIPSELNGIPVRRLGYGYYEKEYAVFAGDTIIKSLTVPETVYSISPYTFADSTALESVNITNSDIGSYSFSNCSALKTVSVASTDSTYTSIDSYAFSNCSSLETATITAEEIGSYAFSNCSALESANIAANYIYSYAFINCSSLKTATISAGQIGSYAFSGCTALETLVITDNHPDEYGNTYCYISEGGFDNCTSLKSMTLPASIGWSSNIFTNVPRNAKIFVENESSAQRQLMDLGFTNFAVHIVLKEIRIPGTVSVEIGKTIAALNVTKYPVAASETLNIQWSSGDDTVASVDPVTGKITGHKLGSAVITATDLNSGKTAQATVSVVIPYADKLTAVVTPQIPAAGLELGQTAQLQVYTTSAGLLDPVCLTFTSSDDSIATVDDNGVITAVNNSTKAYNVKITARLTDDSKNRSVAVSVTAIPEQTASLTIYSPTEETVDDVIVIPYEKVASAAYSFALNAVPLNARGEMTTAPVTWKSTNTGVAAVAKDGTVTIKAKANGIATIVATVNDLSKATAEITIDVRDYTPRIENNTVTLNTYTTLSEQLHLVKVYDNNITSVTFDNTEYFNATYDAETDIVYVDANGFVKNGIYKLNLIAETEKGTYGIPVTVKVTNKLPTVTIKQAAPFNLFLKNSTATVNFTAKGEEITNVVLSDTDTFAAEYDSENGTLNIAYAFPADPVSTYENGKADTAATVEIYLENYTDPIVKTFKINAKETKVTLAASRTSTKFTLFNHENTPIQLTDKTTKQVINLDECIVELQSTSEGFADYSVEGKKLLITPVLTNGKFADGRTSHTVKMKVCHENWIKDVAVNHTITVNTTVPTVKAKTATLTLNSLFDASASTVMIPNTDNCPQPLYWEISPATPAQAAETDKLTVEADGWNVTASFNNPDDLPANGSYKYNLVAYVEADGEMALKPVTITVRINNTMPKVTLGKTSVRLNSQLEDNIAVTTKIPAGYLLEDVIVENATGNTATEQQLCISFNTNDNTVVARIGDSNLPNGTYRYTLTPVVKADAAGSEKTAELKPLTLSVAVYSALPAITANGKGAIDLVNRDNGIVYTVTAGRNFNYNANTVNDQSFTLTGNDKDKFEVVPMLPNANGQPQVMVKAKAGENFSTKATYQYALNVNIDGMSKPVSTTVFKIKPKQTVLKLTATGNLNVYQSTKSGRVYINVATSADAQIADIQVVSKGTTVPNGALTFDLEKVDGRWVLSYRIDNVSRLKANATYRIALAVTPDGNASDKAPQTFNVTLKVKR